MNKGLPRWTWVVVGLSAAVLIMDGLFLWPGHLYSWDLQKWGLLGDAIGGITGPFTLLAVLVAYKTLKATSEAQTSERRRGARQVVMIVSDARFMRGEYAKVEIVNGSPDLILLGQVRLNSDQGEWQWDDDEDPPAYLPSGHVWSNTGAFFLLEDSDEPTWTPVAPDLNSFSFSVMWTDPWAVLWARTNDDHPVAVANRETYQIFGARRLGRKQRQRVRPVDEP